MYKNVLLIDLPTFPKGVLSLSLLTIAGILKSNFNCKYLDLNFESDRIEFQNASLGKYAFVGMKVSSQNFSIAIEATQYIKQHNPSVKVVWGGELPTLLKDQCLANADVIITGLFESIADEFIEDVKNQTLKSIYTGSNRSEYGFGIPDFSIVAKPCRYNTSMGLPLETSRGCSQRCLFCMVLIMQAKNYYVKSNSQLEHDLQVIGRQFLNVVDYNIGINKHHVLNLASCIKQSEVLGWMAEMNIEMLDDDELLQSLKNSRCKIIYCGLESVDEQALQFVNKDKTNNVLNYERIIRKVQSYGIDIAAGLILGLDNADETSYIQTLKFFDRMGLIYTKFTFLVYNPGTKVKEYMARRGEYVTNEIDRYDGLQVSFLPKGQKESDLYNQAELLMKNYYSWFNIWRRSGRLQHSLFRRFEYFLFAVCYSQVYQSWTNSRNQNGNPNVSLLVSECYSKNWQLTVAEKLLHVVRLINYRYA